MSRFLGFMRQRVVQISIVAIGVLVTSCSEGKVAQCNRLIEVANQAVGEVQTVTQTATPNNNVESLSQIAAAAGNARSSMEGLTLSDQRLKDFQSRFITMYENISKAANDLVAAANSQDATAAQTAYDALKTATDQESPLVNEVNGYCSTQ